MCSVSNIKMLRILCGGTGNNIWYGQQLTPTENCEALLSVPGFQRVLSDKTKSSSWIRLANTLFPLIEKNEKFRATFYLLLKLILGNGNLVGRKLFLQNIWDQTAHLSHPVDIEIVEEFIEREPKFIEIKLIKSFGKVLQNIPNKNEIRNFWNSDENFLFIKWSLASASIFSAITSIMNEFLLRCLNKQFLVVLELIKLFINNISKMCNTKGKNFVNLYPLEYRHFVYLLRCKPSTLVNKEEIHLNEQIVPIIQEAMENQPHSTIALLSHHVACNF